MIAFYSRNWDSAQFNHTTTERKLLSVVETLKEFRNILVGQQIKVYIDHKNLTYKTFNTGFVMRWKFILDKYSSELIYTQGSKNIAAGSLSRLDIVDVLNPVKNYINSINEHYGSDDEDISHTANYETIIWNQ